MHPGRNCINAMMNLVLVPTNVLRLALLIGKLTLERPPGQVFLRCFSPGHFCQRQTGISKRALKSMPFTAASGSILQ